MINTNKKSPVIFVINTLFTALLILSADMAHSDSENDYYNADSELDYGYESKGIKNVNGKFYAYIVLLFNENPHFVNLIQKDSIPLKMMAEEGFNIREYKHYISSVHEKGLKKISQTILQLYLEPEKFDKTQMEFIEQQLSERNIILQFTRDRNSGTDKIALNYCIFGKKIPISISHPLMNIKEPIYNIQPYIYYDEFSTSNSTFYYDMIYINPVEVHNDFIIAQKIISGENVNSLFFVGSRVTAEIKYCLQKAFTEKKTIKDEIWKMFVIHELTHKVLNNTYNNFDQITGEELSLCSTIYYNPYLGLSVLYSYLNYNSINPHRIAALNYIKYIAEKTGKPELISNPSLLKQINPRDLKTMSKEHFSSQITFLKD